jgi:hypothetical protein
MGEGILMTGRGRTAAGGRGMRAGMPVNRASQRIKGVYAEIKKNGYTRTQPFSIGSIGEDVKRFAKARGITLASRDIYVNARFLSHSQRPSKGAKRVTKKDITDFPVTKRRMSKYWDGSAFVFTDYKIKFIVNPNYELKINRKTKVKVCLVTAGTVTDPNEFTRLKKYERV